MVPSWNDGIMGLERLEYLINGNIRHGSKNSVDFHSNAEIPIKLYVQETCFKHGPIQAGVKVFL